MTVDRDEIIGELQQVLQLFERQAERCDELLRTTKQETVIVADGANPGVPVKLNDRTVLRAKRQTFRECAKRVRLSVDKLRLDPEEQADTDPGVVRLIRRTSMASDQVGDELALKVHHKLWRRDGFTPPIEPHEEEPLRKIRALDEDEAWDLIVRVLKQVGHY